MSKGRRRTCAYASICARAAISIVQHVPRGMENECFQAGAVCSRGCVHVGNAGFIRDNKDRGVVRVYAKII